MNAKYKSKVIVFLVVVAVLAENYLVYSCLFDCKRSYIDLLRCGIFAHIIVAIMVWLNLWAIIPTDKATVKVCGNIDGNDGQHQNEGKAEDKPMSSVATIGAKSDKNDVHENIATADSNAGKTQIEVADTARAVHITQAKSEVKDTPPKKPVTKSSTGYQEPVPPPIVAPAPDMMILQDQRDWMASDLHRSLMFDFELQEALDKVLRRKGVSQDFFYRKIASASMQLHVSMYELIDKLRIIQYNRVAMEEVVSAILLIP